MPKRMGLTPKQKRSYMEDFTGEMTWLSLNFSEISGASMWKMGWTRGRWDKEAWKKVISQKEEKNIKTLKEIGRSEKHKGGYVIRTFDDWMSKRLSQGRNQRSLPKFLTCKGGRYSAIYPLRQEASRGMWKVENIFSFICLNLVISFHRGIFYHSCSPITLCTQDIFQFPVTGSNVSIKEYVLMKITVLCFFLKQVLPDKANPYLFIIFKIVSRCSKV